MSLSDIAPVKITGIDPLEHSPRDAERIREARREATLAAECAYEFKENGFCKAHDSVTCLVCRDRAAERRHRELLAVLLRIADKTGSSNLRAGS